MWFAYDGWVGYPRQNRQEYENLFKPEPAPESLKIYPKVTKALEESLAGAKSLAEISQAVGGEPSRKTAVDCDWFGPTGRLTVKLSGDAPAGPPEFKEARKSDTELISQKGIALALVAGAVVTLARLAKIRSTRYVLDDNGLSAAGVGPIPWDAMQRLDTDSYVEKGWVDLRYVAGGQERSVRLDSYEIAAFDDIIDEICRRKAFENPLPVEKGGSATG